MKKITLAILSAALISSGTVQATNDFLNRNLEINRTSLLQAPAFLLPSICFPVKKGKKLKEGGGSAFEQGCVVITAGYGWPNLGKAVIEALISDSATNVKSTGLGPIHFKAEYGLSDGVGMGVSVNYINFGVSFFELPYDYDYSRSSLSILARINFHFGTTDQLDPYFGVGAGYRQASWKFKSTDPNYQEESIPGFSPFGFETTIGLRYYFTEGFGIYTEIGIAKSVIQGGLAVKF